MKTFISRLRSFSIIEVNRLKVDEVDETKKLMSDIWPFNLTFDVGGIKTAFAVSPALTCCQSSAEEHLQFMLRTCGECRPRGPCIIIKACKECRACKAISQLKL